MEYAWVAVAFACGFLAKQINLPPLVGYLGARRHNAGAGLTKHSMHLANQIAES